MRQSSVNEKCKTYLVRLWDITQQYLNDYNVAGDTFLPDGEKAHKFEANSFNASESSEILRQRLADFKFDCRKLKKKSSNRNKEITFIKSDGQLDLMTKHFYKSPSKKSRSDARETLQARLDNQGLILESMIICCYCWELQPESNIDLDHLQPKTTFKNRIAMLFFLINHSEKIRDAFLRNPEFEDCYTKSRYKKREQDNYVDVYFPSRQFIVSMFNDRRNLLPSCKTCNQGGEKHATTLNKFFDEIRKNTNDPFNKDVVQLEQPIFDHFALFSRVRSIEGMPMVGTWVMGLYCHHAASKLELYREQANMKSLIDKNHYSIHRYNQINRLLMTANSVRQALFPTQQPNNEDNDKPVDIVMEYLF